MKAIIPKYNEEGSKIIGKQEVEVIGQVKYEGDDCASFQNEKIYNVIEILGYMVRVIDEDEDYLYMFDDPTINWDGINGKFIVVNDFTEDRDYNLYMSVRNIEKTFVLDSRELRIFWLIKQDKVILTKEALAAIEEVLA